MSEEVIQHLTVNIAKLKKILPYIMKQRYGILIRGPHGIGKSEIVQQLKTEIPKILGLDIEEMGFIDKRLSQCSDAGEITGVPTVQERETILNPMDWYRKACEQPCILLLDELDRAQIDVKQAVFELGDSRKIAGFPLHKDTVVVACVNGGPATDSGYIVKTFDPAELDRWAVFEFKPTVQEWLNWAKNNVKQIVYDYIKQNPKFLEYDLNQGLEANLVYPSRRSWKRLSDSLPEEWINEKSELIPFMAYSFIGYEAANHFFNFIKTWEKKIDIKSIVTKGKFDFVDDLSEPKIAEVCERLVELDINKTNMKEKYLQNIANFMNAIPREMANMFWTNWSNITTVNNMMGIHPHVKELLGKLNGTV